MIHSTWVHPRVGVYCCWDSLRSWSNDRRRAFGDVVLYSAWLEDGINALLHGLVAPIFAIAKRTQEPAHLRGVRVCCDGAFDSLNYSGDDVLRTNQIPRTVEPLEI